MIEEEILFKKDDPSCPVITSWDNRPILTIVIVLVILWFLLKKL